MKPLPEWDVRAERYGPTVENIASYRIRKALSVYIVLYCKRGARRLCNARRRPTARFSRSARWSADGYNGQTDASGRNYAISLTYLAKLL